jgi:hypothetical protein
LAILALTSADCACRWRCNTDREPPLTYSRDGKRQTGRRATDLAYWDAVAALGTPADLTDWTHCVDDDGNQLSTAERTERRDTFLRATLDNL